MPINQSLRYFQISFTVVGHTKFAPDLLFSLTARDFYASDVFNERELIAVMERRASVVFDSGRIVRAWRETVTKKYSSLPGIRGLHDFLALRNSGENAMMKVRDSCYTYRHAKSHAHEDYKGNESQRQSSSWSGPILFCSRDGQRIAAKQAEPFKSNVCQLHPKR